MAEKTASPPSVSGPGGPAGGSVTGATPISAIFPGFPAVLTPREELVFRERFEAACVQLVESRAAAGGPYNMPYGDTPDELTFVDSGGAKNYAGSFHKLLEHDSSGYLTAGVGIPDYGDLIAGLQLTATSSDFDQARFNAITKPPTPTPPPTPTVHCNQDVFQPPGPRVFVNPQSSKAVAIKGADAASIPVWTLTPDGGGSKAGLLGELSLQSATSAADLLELYGMSLLRDLDLRDYADNHPTVALVLAALNEASVLAAFRGPVDSATKKVTAATLFRGISAGDLRGDYISQFFQLRRIPLFPSGCAPFVANLTNVGVFAARFSQSYLVPEPNRREFGVTRTEYVQIQNGEIPRDYDAQDFLDRTVIHTGRHLGSAVHVDSLYEEWTFAVDVLTAGSYPRSVCSPYTKSDDNPPLPPLAENEGDGPTLGPPDAYGLLGAIALEAARAAWTQKWLVARRGRPELMAGLVEFLNSQLSPILRSPSTPVTNLLNAVRANNLLQAGNLGKWGYGCLPEISTAEANTVLLSQLFPEGSPAHPAWPSGHATIAGACATLIKAIFRDTAPILDPNAEPGVIRPLLVDGMPLTVGGELDKMASNIAFGRNFAGVHFRADGEHGIVLGEEIAIRFLQDHLRGYRETFRGGVPCFELTKRYGQRVRITKNAVAPAPAPKPTPASIHSSSVL